MPRPYRRCVIGTLLAHAIAAVVVSPPLALLAQTTSITSSGLNTRVTTRPNTTIHDITGGTRPQNGPNLFHSFGEFSIGTSNIANFLNETALPTANILGRVTGGNPSNIFGTIQTENFGAANLYLINPAGVMFGPTASLNVGGSFTATTADYLKMTDGAKFYANPSQSTILSIAPLASFGFLNPQPGPIRVEGSNMLVPMGQTFSLIGGNIDIRGVQNTFQANLRARKGVIQMASVASEGEVKPVITDGLPDLDVSSFLKLGQIRISDHMNVTVSSTTGAGTIVLRAGRLEVESAFLGANSLGATGDSAQVGIDIKVTDELIARKNPNDTFLAQCGCIGSGTLGGGNSRRCSNRSWDSRAS